MPDALPRFSRARGAPAPRPPRPDPLTALLVRFAGELRAAGLAVGSGDVLVYCSALARLDPSDLVDLYWAGRARPACAGIPAPSGAGRAANQKTGPAWCAGSAGAAG